MEEINTDQNSSTLVHFFPLAPRKLVVMSICTLGLYEIYWFYRNWKFLKKEKGLNISPFWRAWFLVLFCYSLFKNVKNYANEKGVQATFSPGGLATAFIIVTFTSRLPAPIWLISIFTFIPLLTVQATINELNKDQLEKVINRNFSGWNIFGIVVGVILWALIILGALSSS